MSPKLFSKKAISKRFGRPRSPYRRKTKGRLFQDAATHYCLEDLHAAIAAGAIVCIPPLICNIRYDCKFTFLPT